LLYRPLQPTEPLPERLRVFRLDEAEHQLPSLAGLTKLRRAMAEATKYPALTDEGIAAA